jgi:tRNA (guanine26-N2/guanine27-N2)-dimethyltransferase
MLALTATDMAPLCGVNPKACMRKYGGRPLRTEYGKEVALRLVAGILVKTSARHKASSYPVFGYAADHYVRLYAVLTQGARNANQCLNNMGYLLHCFKCNNRRPATIDELRDGRECSICGTKMSIGGPLWLGDYSDREFCKMMLNLSESSLLYSEPKLLSLIRIAGLETGFGPSFYNIDGICSTLKTPSISTENVISAVRDAGYQVTRTNFDERGMKTEATIDELKSIVSSLTHRAG